MVKSKKTSATPKKQFRYAALKNLFGLIRSKVSKARSHNPHRSFRLTGKYDKPVFAAPLVSGKRLLVDSRRFILRNKKLLFGLTLIYIVFNWLAVGIAAQADYTDYRDVVEQVSEGNPDGLEDVGTLFLATLSGAYTTSVSELQQFISTIISFLFVLVLIWAVRNISGGQPVTVRESLYNGPAPFISLLIIAAILMLQLLPGALGVLVFTLANGQTAELGAMSMAFAGAAVLLIALSLYWATSTLLAGIIVTLPNMYPVASMSLAKQLILGRRFAVFLRFLVLLIVLIIVWAIILLPVIYLDATFQIPYVPIVSVAVQLVTGFSLLLSSVYAYRLYRSLL